MPTITVSTETFSALQSLAQPLIDTPDSVIKRLLKAHQHNELNQTVASKEIGTSRTVNPQSLRGQITPRRLYKKLLMQVLQAAGGELEAQTAIQRVGKLMTEKFKSNDLELLKNGEPRWENAVRFARQELVSEGKLDGSRYGFWKLI